MIEVDVETTGVQWYASKLFLVQGMDADGKVEVLRHPEDSAQIQRWLDRANQDPDGARGWNFKFDLHFLEAAGYTLPHPSKWHDGMVASHILDERRSSALKATAEAMFGPDARNSEQDLKVWLKEEDARRRKESKETGTPFEPATYADVPFETMRPYAQDDVILTQRIGAVQDPMIARNPELSALYDLEMDVMRALYDLEKLGVPIDESGAYRLELALAENLDGIRERAVDLAGIRSFNPNSSKQIYKALERRGADLQFVTNGSMDAENIATVDDELARVIEEWRSEGKLMSSYVTPMLHKHWDPTLHAWKHPLLATDGRMHPNIRQIGARTGRMSSSDPNIQNFPRDDLRLRYLVQADPGMKIVTADLSSIELMLFAAYAGDGRMLRAIQEGRDPHAETAEFIGLQDFIRQGGHVEKARDRGKKFNYTVLYGGGQRTIRKTYRVNQKRAKEMLWQYHAAYPEVGALQRMIEYRLSDQGYIKSSDLLGTPARRRFRGTERDAYKMMNYLIQGTAALMLKISLVKLHKQGIPLIAPVHDELVAHVSEKDAEEVGHLIVDALTDFPLLQEKVPIQAEAAIVDRWSQAKKPEFVPQHEQELLAA